ncbi:MAG TPA: M20/M25/M40 family metallo-hydrolase [Candidatus Binataceae bacterium]|nr:M20/M25/M40 family metallo-hydrolase [Candidatus Binataceae bacterium]
MRVAWENIQNEALDILRTLVRLDTSNPPGNERIAVDVIAELLGGHGIDSVIRQSAPTRANLVARIPGADRSKPALMLSSHTDVVPVERSGWTREPFGAETHQGCIWGRGTIDMKSKGAMDLVLVTALKRAGAIPNCDLILAAVADEEAGSDLGAKFLVERHPDLVRAGWVLNEVGGFTLHIGKRRLYPIQVAEKGFVTVKMSVTAPPGHGSMPRKDTAISKISALITKIVNTPMRRRVSPLMRRTLAELGLPEEDPGPLLRPMLGNTVSPTILRAGYKDNVIPGEASVVLDGRTVPGEDPESFMAELRRIVGPEPKFELIKTAPPAETSADTELFDLICRRIEAADPGARAIPWMTPGATDNKFYARLGSQCYGFSPVKLHAHMPFGSLFHGNDERLPIDGFFWGLKVYAEVVLEFLGLRFDEVFS